MGCVAGTKIGLVEHEDCPEGEHDITGRREIYILNVYDRNEKNIYIKRR